MALLYQLLTAASLCCSCWALSTATKSYQCPAYCECDDLSLVCHDGYVMDWASLRLLNPDITSLYIKNFVIREISSKHFKWFKNLKQLSVIESRIRSIDENAFAELHALEKVDLSHNHLTELPDAIFSYQKNLAVLNLAGNLIEHLPATLLVNTTRIGTLSLRDNRLRLLPHTLFDTLTQLQHLDLSHNELTYILPRTFNFISKVRYIDLNDNLLVTLNEDLFDSNNITVLTKLSVANNPLECNCGMKWLREATLGDYPHIELVNATQIVCANPFIYHGDHIGTVPLEQLNCTEPTAVIKQSDGHHFHRNKAELECRVSGSPPPSILWRTPMSDMITDPYQGEWLDSSVTSMSSEKKYRIYATGETVHFTIRTSPGFSTLVIDSLHLVSSGEYDCIAINPGGNSTASVNVTMESSIDIQYYPSLVAGAGTVLLAIIMGIIGCSVTACVEHCNCCHSDMLKYYDGAWMNCGADKKEEEESADKEEVEDQASSDEESDDEDDELMGAVGGSASISSADLMEFSSASSYIYSVPPEINEHTELTAEEWDDYFRQYPGDFIVEAYDGSPRKAGSDHGSPCGSPRHKLHGRTLETLEGVRVRLKLRVEQIDVMRERLRTHMEKRGARMKENIARRKHGMNKRMQVIKETTSQSIQTIKETGRNYTHKLQVGVRTAMENVGYQVQSLKELCGTGDLGQTLSMVTITTDIDTNEKTAITRSVTLV